MAVVSITPAELEAYNKLAPSEQLDNEVKLFENRVRLLPTAGVPLLKELESFFGKEVIIMDRLTAKTEQKTTTAKTTSSTLTSSASYSNEYGPGPLKFDFFNVSKFMNEADWSAKSRFRLFTAADYLSVNPLSVQEAMRLRYNFSWQPSNTAFFTAYPTVLFSDAKDSHQTAFVSIAQDKHNIITSHCRFFGVFDENVEKKLVGLSHRFDSLHAVSKATAVYKFLTPSVQDRRYAGSFPSEMTMTFSWTSEMTPTSYLSSPAATSKVVVHCCPGWKDPRVSLFEETCMLENLLCMAQTLRDGIPMVWPKNEDQSETVIPRVQALIEQCSLTKQEAKGSRFYDFTEQLFDILRLATSNETLVEALRIVFNALRVAKINTILHADNKTTLARLIRDSLAGDLNLPRLEAMTPIQILLEIGIERFRRNMINTFVQEKLVVSSEEFKLQYMDQGGSAEENALKLLPLHLALLTIMELTKYLTMSEHGLSTLRRRVLSDYTARAIETITNMFTFEAAVLFSEINPKMLKCVKPSMWLNEVVYSAKAASPPVARTFSHFTKQLNISYLEDIVNESDNLDNSMEADTTATEIRYACTLLTASYNRKGLEVLQ